MSCTARECRYRGRYECDDQARELGQSVGLCVIELAVRRAYGNDLFDLFERDLPPAKSEEALRLLELLLDALVYAHRATTWVGIAGNEGSPTHRDPEYWQAVTRYRMAASERTWKRYGDLRPFILEAGHRRKEREFDERLEAMRAAQQARSA